MKSIHAETTTTTGLASLASPPACCPDGHDRELMPEASTQEVPSTMQLDSSSSVTVGAGHSSVRPSGRRCRRSLNRPNLASVQMSRKTFLKETGQQTLISGIPNHLLLIARESVGSRRWRTGRDRALRVRYSIKKQAVCSLQAQVREMQQREVAAQEHMRTVECQNKALTAQTQILNARLCNAHMERCCLEHKLTIMARQMAMAHHM